MKKTLLNLALALALTVPAGADTTTLTINNSTGTVNIPAGLIANFPALKIGGVTLSGTPAWSSIAGKPTTWAGYGITDTGSVTATELGYVHGVTQPIQGQLDDLHSTKANLASPTFTGTVVLPSGTSIGTTTATELGYVHGVTSALQTQVDGKQPLNAALTALAGNTGTVNLSGLTLTLPSAFVTLTGTQTLTGKTISGASNTLTVREADISTSDVTTANVSTTKHGLTPKAPNDVTKFLDGTGAWSTPAGGGGGLSSWLIKSTTYTAVAGDYIQADTSGGPWTNNLPASPTAGQFVFLEDAKGAWGTNNLTIGRNGANINGAAGDFTANVNNAKLSAVYIDGTYGWSIK